MSQHPTIDPRTLPTDESVHREILPDGTVLLVRSNPDSPAVVMQGLVQTGAIDDPAAKAGLAGFTAEAMTRGTTNRDAHTLYETIESIGATFSMAGGLHTIRFGAKCLAEDTALMIDLLGDILQNPGFEALELERIRSESLTDLEERLHSTRYRSSQAFRELAYPPEHPYSRTSSGTFETLQDISCSDIQSFYATAIPIRPMILSIVGNIDTSWLRDTVAEIWSRWSRREQIRETTLPEVPPRKATSVRHVALAGKVQTDLVMGVVGPKRSDDDYYAAELANIILGGFGLMGRLGQSVREERGLAYYATSRMDAGLGPGPWACLAGVAPEDFNEAVDTIRAEIQRMCIEPVPQQEFDDCKSYVLGSLPLKLESNEGVANVMLEIEMYNLGWDYLLHFHDKVDAITQEDILHTMQRHFPTGADILTSAGPAMEGFAEVETEAPA
jgi:zinc protease